MGPSHCERGTPLADGRILVTGGESHDPPEGPMRGNPPPLVASAELYAPELDAWESAPDMSTIRCWHSQNVLPDGRVLAAGGWTRRGGFSATTTAEIFDPSTNEWTAATPMSTARVWHATVELADGRILAMGGKNDSGTLSSAEIYAP